MSCMLISERDAVAFCIICASIYISCVSRVSLFRHVKKHSFLLQEHI